MPHSVLETQLLRCLTRAGLPRPVIQFPIRNGRRLLAIVDVAFPWARVAVEADGYRWHAGRARWARDLARRNALTALGWRVIHVTWEDLLRRPDEVAGSIAELLLRHDARQ